MRFWGCSVVLALAAAGCGSNDDGASAPNIDYVALGDSIAYGENLFVPDTKEARPNGEAFVGYPDLLGKDLFANHYANLGCPGVTTASYLSLDGADYGCREFQEKWQNTLHVPYTGTQADKAHEILHKNHVRVVTVGLGGNDLLLTLADCTALTPDDPDAAFGCAVAALPKAIKDGTANLEEIVQRIRDDFDGELIYVNVYSTYLSSEPASLAINAWNKKMAAVVEAAGGEVADAFTAFAAEAEAADGDPCAAGLLVPNPVDGESPACDIHPSEKGARLLADTVQAVPGFAP